MRPDPWLRSRESFHGSLSVIAHAALGIEELVGLLPHTRVLDTGGFLCRSTRSSALSRRLQDSGRSSATATPLRVT
jgi:hypothetical protein